MLNYIWAGLIIISLVFALVSDIRDFSRDAYRNDEPLPVVVQFPAGTDPTARRIDVDILIDPQQYQQFYNTEATPDSVYSGYIVRTQAGNQLRFAGDASLPEPLATIQGVSQSNDDELQGRLTELTPTGPGLISTGVVFEPVRFVKLNAITAAAIEFADTAVTLVLGLIGVIVLFLGLLSIAEAAGIVNAMVRVIQPVLQPLFPEIPKGHPAMGMIIMNLSANMLGLGNAATPLGLKAMEELQKLNPTKDTATNSMIMLLALNTASVQLVPPTLLVAIMGLQVNELLLPIILCTIGSAIVAVTAAKLLGKTAKNRASDPMRQTGAELS
jgi:spore maturation protein A